MNLAHRWAPLSFSANLAMLFREVPFLDRFAAAAQAGFTDVEFLFPYYEGVERVRECVRACGQQVVLFDTPPGDRSAGEFGTLALPHRRDHFQRCFHEALAAMDRLSCTRLNVLYGNRDSRYEEAGQHACAVENLRWALPLAEAAGVMLLIGPLSPSALAPRWLLPSLRSAMNVIEAVSHPRLKLQFDFYHAQINEGNLTEKLTRNFAAIGHIQLADVPGRHEPGTGEINYPHLLETLRRLKYRGYIGLEYQPLTNTRDSLAWLA